MHRFNYIEAIATKYPGVNCWAPGDGSVYESIVWEGGDPLPSQADLDAALLQMKRDHVWESMIKAERDRRKSNGVLVTVPETGVQKWFHSDDTSRIQQIALTIMGASIPANLQWKCLDGTFVTMTAPLASAIFQTSAYFDQQNFANAEQHRAAMMQAADPLAYDYSTGWMPTFTG